jgi:hypothetical protein
MSLLSADFFVVYSVAGLVGYVVRSVEAEQVGLNLKGTHQFMVNADDVGLVGDNINTIKNKL